MEDSGSSSRAAKRGVVQLMGVLSEGFPQFAKWLKENPGAPSTWTLALEDYSDEDLAKAARGLVMHYRFAAPSVADVVEAIEGRVVSVPVYARDSWSGSRLLNPDGSPKILRYEEKRIPLGELKGAEGALELAAATETLALEEGSDAR